jgi:hypothetical protein
MHADILSISADGCSVNLRAHKKIERDTRVNWFLNICISHCTNNARDMANFPTFATFWSLLMKVFLSDTAKIKWESTTGCTWLTYSVTRWFSKYDVAERVLSILVTFRRACPIKCFTG